MTRCFICGSGERLTGAHPHNFLCADYLPAAEHVVSMSNPDGASLAQCKGCGWRSVVPWESRPIQDIRVRLHWRDVIRRARLAAELEGTAA